MPFHAEVFKKHAKLNDQEISYSGVGAHHQNGVAERGIGTVTRWARAMLLQACLDWPEAGKLELWPFALEHAVYVWNNMPRQDSKKTPWELFTGNNRENYSYLNKLHVWGCPVYVLDEPLQPGLGGKPKWSERSHVGAYLGHSHHHS